TCRPTGSGLPVDELEALWALPQVDERRVDELKTLSIQMLPAEVRAGLDAAIAAYEQWAAMEPLVRATLAAAAEEARENGALRGHPGTRVGRRKPWLSRLLDQWRARGAQTPRAPDTQEGPLHART